MRNGKWYLVYTSTHTEYDEMAGCCGGAGSGGAFVDVAKSVSIVLEATTAKLAKTEAEQRWKRIRADIEAKWEKEKKGDRHRDWPHHTHGEFLKREANNPRVVYASPLEKEDADEQ